MELLDLRVVVAVGDRSVVQELHVRDALAHDIGDPQERLEILQRVDTGDRYDRRSRRTRHLPGAERHRIDTVVDDSDALALCTVAELPTSVELAHGTDLVRVVERGPGDRGDHLNEELLQVVGEAVPGHRQVLLTHVDAVLSEEERRSALDLGEDARDRTETCGRRVHDIGFGIGTFSGIMSR